MEGLTQTSFAKKMNMSVQNLNDLEKGRKTPSPVRAAQIAKKLGFPEVSFIQLSLQDSLAKEGFYCEVKLKSV